MDDQPPPIELPKNSPALDVNTTTIEPTQNNGDKPKPKRKPRTLTEEQRKTMLENLRKGREKAHVMRREMEKQRKTKAHEPKKPTPPQSSPEESTPEPRPEPRPKPRQRKIIYEQENTDSDDDTPIVVRRVIKATAYKQPPPPPPPILKREPTAYKATAYELKRQEELIKRQRELAHEERMKKQKEQQLKKVLNNFFV